MEYKYDEITATRPLQAFTKEEIKNLKMLAVNKSKFSVVPFGSTLYRIQKYPGDLDALETYSWENRPDLLLRFKKMIQKVVQKIESSKNHFFSEFKAGYDPRGAIAIEPGPIQDGIWKIDRAEIEADTELMYYHQIYNKKTVESIEKILSVKNPGSDEYDALLYIIREHAILRWSAEDVKKGYLILPGKGKIKYDLINALNADAPIKIDMISLVNNRLTEVTNFYTLVVGDKNNFEYPVNITPDLYQNEEQNIQELKAAVEELYFSNVYYNPFKCAKRMWSIARQTGNENDVIKLTPLISGDVSLLYQIKSEIDVILRLFELDKDESKIINKQLDLMKPKLANVIFIPQDDLKDMYDIIDKAIDSIKTNTRDKLIKDLKKLIIKYITVKTIQELDSIGMNPPPNRYLPRKKMYANILRTPYEEIEDPLVKYGIK